MKWLVVAMAALAGLLLWRFSMSASRNLPRAGQAAPDFELPDQHGKARSLGEFRGRRVALYFFPRADTPG